MSLRRARVPPPIKESARSPLLSNTKKEVELVTYKTTNGNGRPLPIVQFSSPMYYVEEIEKEITLDIMRLGPLTGKCTVRYRTEDASGKAGIRYVEASGHVTFMDREHTKPITIGIIDSDSFMTTLEFKVVLSDPFGCELGAYLNQCRVKVIDDSCFPHDDYKDYLDPEIPGKSVEEISELPFFRAYLRHNFLLPGHGWRTILVMIMDQLTNVYAFILLYINVYLVDVLFNPDKKTAEARMLIKAGPYGGRVLTAQLIGVLYIVPMVLLHLWDFAKGHIDLRAMSADNMRVMLFRKYLSYDRKSRSEVSAAQMELAILEETNKVTDGYLAVIGIMQQVGKLLIFMYFISLENPRALVGLIFMPMSMLLFVRWRSAKMAILTEETTTARAELMDFVVEVCEKYSIIADFQQRPHVSHEFEELNEEESEAGNGMELCSINNAYFAKWLGPSFIAVFIATHAVFVLEGELSLGIFLATIKIFTEASELFEDVYKLMMTVSVAIGPLKRLAVLLNKSTDLLPWKKNNRERRAKTKEARLEAFRSAQTGAFNSDADSSFFFIDTIDLKVMNVTFKYPGAEQLPPLLDKVTLSISQGNLIAVIGEHGSGKNTLLKLIGHTLFPEKGIVAIPTHLRILHVCSDPIMLTSSIWENLTFGSYDPRPGSTEEDEKKMKMEMLGRVKEIMKRMDMKKAQAQLEEELKTGDGHIHPGNNANWALTLPTSELVKIHLTRAFIMNPEVLVLQRPLSHFDNKEERTVAKALRDHMEGKGLDIQNDSEEKKVRRRPRTCFFTPTRRAQIDLTEAEVIWKVVNDQNIVVEIGREQLDKESNEEF